MNRRAALLLLLAPVPGAIAQVKREPGAVERLRRMSPDERKRALKQMTPERRKRAEQMMRKLDEMPEAEREEFERRYESFQRMPPQSQEKARVLFRRLNELPADRREALRREIEALRGLSSGEREEHLKGAGVRKRFNEKELGILRDYVRLLSGGL
jgi:hypothetical protein